MVAVVVREARLTLGRRIGELEHHYISLFDRFAHMIAEGTFPFRQDDDQFEDAPRVGDGVIVLDPDLRVRFASPNAVSSMHRMGIQSYASGVLLVDMDFDQHAAAAAVLTRAPVTEEIEHGDTSLLVRAIPFLDGDEIAGVVVLARDVTDLRRRDRMLLSKDATIREIHHRVKNNLQTIAALLRLQGRRLESRRGARGARGVGTADPGDRDRARDVVAGRRRCRAVRRHPAPAGEGRAGDRRHSRDRSALRGRR